MKFKVTYEYRGKVTVEVDAEDAASAEIAGLEEADEAMNGSLHVYDVNTRACPVMIREDLGNNNNNNKTRTII